MELKKETVKQHDNGFCSKNYLRSSKGMEAHSLLLSAQHLHLNHNCVLETIVMDDNSSLMNILQWYYEAAIAEGILTHAPTTPGGNKKANKGQLPLTHPLWKKLADQNHRLQCLAGKIYNFARKPMGESLCTRAEADRLKHNICYAVHEYKIYDFSTFKRMVWAVLHHHFGCHETCGPTWCPWLKSHDKPEERKN
jgi:hypothetical protein